MASDASAPVRIEPYTPQTLNDIRNARATTADLENALIPLLERLKNQKEDYESSCGLGATDEGCRAKGAQMAKTWLDTMNQLRDNLEAVSEQMSAASRSLNARFSVIGRLRPSDLYDDIAYTNRTTYFQDQSTAGRKHRPLSQRMLRLLQTVGMTDESQAETFIHAAADLSTAATYAHQLLTTVQYQSIVGDPSTIPPDAVLTAYDGLIPAVLGFITGGEEVEIPRQHDDIMDPLKDDLRRRRVN
jgi:hypothetical protein